MKRVNLLRATAPTLGALFALFGAVLFWPGAPATAQQKQPVTSVQPDCMIFFSLNAASSGAQAPVNAAGTSIVIDNHQAGCYGFTVAYTNHGFAALSLSFQSAPDNAAGTAPGTWATVAVCGGIECLGINPNTSITSAITTTRAIAPWYRMNLTSITGTGAVVGVLYGWKLNINANGGGSLVLPPNVYLATNGVPVPIASNNAAAPSSIPIGPASSAAGSEAIAIGARAAGVGASSIAIGPDATPNNTNGICIGSGCDATGSSAMGVGASTQVNGLQATAVGAGATVMGDHGLALGDQAAVNASGAVSIGRLVSNSVANSVNIGSLTTFVKILVNGLELPTVTFGALAALNNGNESYCSDCTVTSSIDNTCAGSGGGAIAQRLGGAWKCSL